MIQHNQARFEFHGMVLFVLLETIYDFFHNRVFLILFI